MKQLFKINKLYPFILLTPIILTNIGCTQLISKRPSDINTYFKSFKLNQSNSDGNIVFKMKSPQAIINSETKSVKANETEITFYEQDIPVYNVTSNKSVISNDGKVIVLLGDVFLTRLNENKITMSANEVEWNSNTSTIRFQENVVGNMETTVIRSNQATYFLNTQKMIFSELQEYVVKDDASTKNLFELTAKTATWDGKSGKLTFDSEGNRVKSKFIIPLND